MNEQLISARLTVLLFTDIVDSTDFKSKYGIAKYKPRLERHNELFESARRAYPNSHILKSTGDGFFAEFATASDAVIFALRFQRALYDEPWEQFPLKSRIGIHMGQVATISVNEQSDVVGLPADLAARIMGLAEGGQILLSRAPFEDAKQFLREGAVSTGDKLVWKCWGEYLIKGSEDPMEILEVGIQGIAPLVKPPGSDKAKPIESAELAKLLDWKPTPESAIPSKPQWVLKEKIGQGAFGDVWLAQHVESSYRHVFKFCSDSTKLRSLEQEMRLFDRLRQKLGYRRDIAQLVDVNVRDLPFFLESEFAEGGDLAAWAARQGGIEKIPLQTRLTIMAEVADALAAAHSVGVLHKDIKPGNVLIDLEHEVAESADKPPASHFQARLADFGIGSLTPESIGAGAVESPSNLMSSTQLPQYAAPEVHEGAKFTIQSDIFALGVLLFQMVSGNLRRSLGQGWERSIADPFLREDIAACIDGDPAKRLTSAAELATRLRTLEARTKEKKDKETAEAARLQELQRVEQARQNAVAAAEKARQQIRRTRRRALLAGTAAVALLLAVGLYIHDRDTQRAVARNEAVANFLFYMLHSADPFKARSNGYDETIVYVLDQAKARLSGGASGSGSLLLDQPAVRALVCDCLGQVYRHFGRIDDAKWAYEQALQADQTDPELDLTRRTTLEVRYAAALLDSADDDPQKQQKLHDVLETLKNVDAQLPANDPLRCYWRFQKARAERAGNNTGNAIQLLTDAIGFAEHADFAGDEAMRRQFEMRCECELAPILQSVDSHRQEAAAHFEIIKTALDQGQIPDSLLKMRCNSVLAKMSLDAGNIDAATKYAGEQFRLAQLALGDKRLDTVWARYDLANTQKMAQRYADECVNRQALYQWAVANNSPMLPMFAGDYGLCLAKLNQPDRAAPLLDECVKRFSAEHDLSPDDTQRLKDAQTARTALAVATSPQR
jgi:class 3 adenylate cyclase/transposase